MTRQFRLAFFVLSAAALGLLFALGYAGLPHFGHVTSIYADIVNSISVPQRHITDVVTAVNFDIRGFDTLGEEFILFTSVMGIVLLMRRTKDEPVGDHEDRAPGRTVPPPSDAVRVVALLLIAPTILFGWYIVAHGQVTPGGGFQGGVILSSAPLLLYLCGSYPKFRGAAAPRLTEIAEAIGAGAYIIIGGACVALGGLFLENVLPLGKTGTLASGGMVPFINLGVGLEVSGGFVLILIVYLEELMEEKES
jgi:multicomponent Na+:H+ antiporter subunit B